MKEKPFPWALIMDVLFQWFISYLCPKIAGMEVTLNRINENYHFEGKGASEVPVNIDTNLDGPSRGSSPMELVLMGVGGCSAVDIVNILKKQRQEISAYKMKIKGDRKKVRQATPFKAIEINIFLEGEIEESKAVRAAQLSFEKYCSVSITLGDSVKISYGLTLNGKEIAIK